MDVDHTSRRLQRLLLLLETHRSEDIDVGGVHGNESYRNEYAVHSDDHGIVTSNIASVGVEGGTVSQSNNPHSLFSEAKREQQQSIGKYFHKSSTKDLAITQLTDVLSKLLTKSNILPSRNSILHKATSQHKATSSFSSSSSSSSISNPLVQSSSSPLASLCLKLLTSFVERSIKKDRLDSVKWAKRSSGATAFQCLIRALHQVGLTGVIYGGTVDYGGSTDLDGTGPTHLGNRRSSVHHVNEDSQSNVQKELKSILRCGYHNEPLINDIIQKGESLLGSDKRKAFCKAQKYMFAQSAAKRRAALQDLVTTYCADDGNSEIANLNWQSIEKEFSKEEDSTTDNGKNNSDVTMNNERSTTKLAWYQLLNQKSNLATNSETPSSFTTKTSSNSISNSSSTLSRKRKRPSRDDSKHNQYKPKLSSDVNAFLYATRRVVEKALDGLLDDRWECRHGSSLLLSSLFTEKLSSFKDYKVNESSKKVDEKLYPTKVDEKVYDGQNDDDQGKDKGVKTTKSEVNKDGDTYNNGGLSAFVNAVFVRCIYVLILDRFVDYHSGDIMYAPVQERNAKLLAQVTLVRFLLQAEYDKKTKNSIRTPKLPRSYEETLYVLRHVILNCQVPPWEPRYGAFLTIRVICEDLKNLLQNEQAQSDKNEQAQSDDSSMKWILDVVASALSVLAKSTSISGTNSEKDSIDNSNSQIIHQLSVFDLLCLHVDGFEAVNKNLAIYNQNQNQQRTQNKEESDNDSEEPPMWEEIRCAAANALTSLLSLCQVYYQAVLSRQQRAIRRVNANGLNSKETLQKKKVHDEGSLKTNNKNNESQGLLSAEIKTVMIASSGYVLDEKKIQQLVQRSIQAGLEALLRDYCRESDQQEIIRAGGESSEAWLKVDACHVCSLIGRGFITLLCLMKLNNGSEVSSSSNTNNIYWLLQHKSLLKGIVKVIPSLLVNMSSSVRYGRYQWDVYTSYQVLEIFEDYFKFQYNDQKKNLDKKITM
eukprot:g3700.t1